MTAHPALDLLTPHLLAAATHHARRLARLMTVAEVFPEFTSANGGRTSSSYTVTSGPSRAARGSGRYSPNVGRAQVGTRPTPRTPSSRGAGRCAPAAGRSASLPAA